MSSRNGKFYPYTYETNCKNIFEKCSILLSSGYTINSHKDKRHTVWMLQDSVLYLEWHISYEEVYNIFNLRALTVNQCKMYFPTVYENDKLFKLGCTEEDSLSHSFSCHQINMHDITLNAIFASIEQQKSAVSVLIRRHSIRSALLQADYAYQGIVLGTSTQP